MCVRAAEEEGETACHINDNHTYVKLHTVFIESAGLQKATVGKSTSHKPWHTFTDTQAHKHVHTHTFTFLLNSWIWIHCSHEKKDLALDRRSQRTSQFSPIINMSCKFPDSSPVVPSLPILFRCTDMHTLKDDVRDLRKELKPPRQEDYAERILILRFFCGPSVLLHSGKKYIYNIKTLNTFPRFLVFHLWMTATLQSCRFNYCFCLFARSVTCVSTQH